MPTHPPTLSHTSVAVVAVVVVVVVLVAVVVVVAWRAPSGQTVIQNIFKHHTNIHIVHTRNHHASVTTPIATDAAVLHVHHPRMYERVLRQGELGFAESYMAGEWSSPDLERLLHELLVNQTTMTDALQRHSLSVGWRVLVERVRGWWVDRNSVDRAQSNIQSHYDVGNDLYTRMLGPTMQYTCAYYHRPDLSLDEAQRAKMALVAHKLDLRPGMRVLDIGCGFGAMAYYLAATHGVHVTGVTLSEAQVQLARARFAHPHVEILLRDYRHVEGAFDRVYSVGMFEHVGQRNYETYFETCDRLLRTDGVMLLHTIAQQQRHSDHDSFIHKYIFPGGELPHLSHIGQLQALDAWHLEDVHTFGLSYAKTLRAWRDNIGDWGGLCPRTYPPRFRRMWDFYLQGCAAAFEAKNIFLWQMVFTKYASSRPNMEARIRGFVSDKMGAERAGYTETGGETGW